MKERIGQLARGEILKEKAEIIFAQERIEETVPPGGVWRRELVLASQNQVRIRGIFYSTNPRVVLKNSQISGYRGRMEYEVSAVRMEAGEQIEGEFQLISDSGECAVPYCFTVSGGPLGSRKPETLQEFVSLAEEDFGAAARLLSERSFSRLPWVREAKTRVLYEGLRGSCQEELAAEQFLLSLGVKKPAKIRLVSEEASFPYPNEPVQGKILLERTGWGGASLRVTSGASFLKPSAARVSGRDFIGNRAQISYEILPDRLHRGKNCGAILLEDGICRLVYRVRIEPEESGEGKASAALRQETLKFTELMLDWQADTYDAAQTRARIRETLKRLEEKDPEDERIKLFLAWVELEEGQRQEAERTLLLARDSVLDARADKVETYAFYLYLRARLNQSREQRETAAKLIRKYYEEWKQTLPLFLLMEETDPELKENKSLQLAMMKELYGAGCRSPFLYGKACRIFREEEELLRVMEGFEIQTLLYGARRNMLTPPLAAKAAELAAYEKQWKQSSFYLLEHLYQEFQSKEILTAICGMLIRAGRTGKRYFPWYQEAVRQDLPVTSLCEYYLYALPEDWDEPLPQNVLLYFSYRHELNEESREVLYENVLRFQKPGSPVYEAYKNQMEQFVFDELLQGKISSRLAPLYKKVVQLDVIDERLAKVLPDLLFSRKVTCGQKGMRRAILRYPQLKTETSRLLRQDSCCIPVYAEEAGIFFEDYEGNIYSNLPYQSERLLDEPELEARCKELNPASVFLQLEKCGEMTRRPLIREDLPLVFFFLKQAELDETFAAELEEKVIHYCYRETERDAKLDEFLKAQDGRGLSETGRQELAEALISRGMYEEAYQIVLNYGGLPVRQARLLKLADARIRETAYQREETLLKICRNLYEKGQYNQALLEYLCMYGEGKTGPLRRLLQTAWENHADTYELEERLLGQMLFCGETEGLDEVYGYYRQKHGVPDLLVQAYLAWKCHWYLKEGQSREKAEWMEETKQLLAEGTELADVCKAALLKWFSFRLTLSEEEAAMAEKYMEELCRKGLVLACYEKLEEWARLPGEIAGKVFLQEEREEGAGLFLRCRLKDREDGWKEILDFPEVYPGIYVKPLILFADEEMEYEICQRKEGRERILTEGTIKGKNGAGKQGSLFERINEMAGLTGKNQEKDFKERMIALETEERLTEQLFPPLE